MKENLIQKAITSYLQLKENAWELYFFRSGAWAVRVTWQYKDRFFKTWKKGCPDVTVVKDWKFYWLEVKNEKWRQSEAQKEAEEKIKKAWWEYFIVRSLNDVIELWF